MSAAFELILWQLTDLPASSIRVDEQESHSLLDDLSLGTLDPGASLEKTVLLRSPQPGTKVVDISLYSTVPTSTSPTSSNGDEGRLLRVEELHDSAVVDVLAPFECKSNVSYRRSAGPTGDAIISTLITTPGPRAIHVESLTMREMVRSRLMMHSV